MFLWIDEETAVYIKLEEGVKLSLLDIMERLDGLQNTLLFNQDLINKLIDYKHVIFFRDYLQFDETSKTFMESDSISLTMFTKESTEHIT
jgi:hypothetical protein